MYPVLPRSHKGRYPFTLCTTSYIFPDRIVPNVELLAPCVDEIEILLFESADESLPSKSEIDQLSQISGTSNLTYNVHLPLDIAPGGREASTRRYALDVIKRITDLVAPLSPSTFTLHLPYDETDTGESSIKRWQERNYESMRQLTAGGMEGERISIETLEYPLEWADPILQEFNLSVCIDLGHLMVNGFDVEAVFEQYRERTTIIHLHGVENRRDHVSIDRLSRQEKDSVVRILKQFKGIVSLEVFSRENLAASLEELGKYPL